MSGFTDNLIFDKPDVDCDLVT